MIAVEDIAPLGPFARLRLTTDEAVCELLPGRGALVSRFAVGGDELLYLDESSVIDPSKNVRGGIPVLWPIAGKLPGDAYEIEGHRYAMKQHGFARQAAWDVVERVSDPNGARVVLAFSDDAATRAQYPFAFVTKLAVHLQKADLHLTLTVENRSDRELLHQPGFHPYFRVPASDKRNAEVETDATRALDNRTGKEVELGVLDFAAGEVDLHLLDHTLPGTLLRRPPLRPIRLTWAEGFETLVLWTLPGRDFICVEPWSGPAGALATGEGVRRVSPGNTDDLSWTISV